MCQMAAFFLGYATLPTVPVEKKVFHVMRLSGLNGRITENAAMNDHVANFSKRHVFQKLAQQGSSYYQTNQVVLIVITLVMLMELPGIQLRIIVPRQMVPTCGDRTLHKKPMLFKMNLIFPIVFLYGLVQMILTTMEPLHLP
ncbi:uncharacterized protein [Mytilus edulis]|uniref:uncharacterized protein n=1 Tax=Mytilus edulis TaxID=6550 RepID=UPI0039EF3EEF